MQKTKVVFSAIFVMVLVLSAFATGFAQTSGRGNLSLASDAITLESQESIYPAKDGRIADSTVSKALPDGDRLVSVFVRLEGQPLATYNGGVRGLAPTSPQATGAASLDAKSPESQSYLAYLDAKQADFVSRLAVAAPSAQVTHNYTVVLNAVAMLVRASELDAVARMQGVTGILPDSLEQPQTDSSPQFIGAPTVWNALGGQEHAGEGVVVGVLDTGIWPEHPSFADDGSFPAPPGGPYACDFGNTAWNPNDAPFSCNNKLIGAHEVMSTYKALLGLTSKEFDSARDSNGHGTHTSSTAAGNANVQSTLLGVDQGIVSGIAPRAHVIMYRVCGTGGCYTTDSAAAVQLAILDGVNAINFSISGGSNPYGDAVSLAFFDAYSAGVFVAASAGNAGPGADTTDHREPWTTTVAASEQDRSFVGTVDLTATTGETLHLEGVSITGDVTAPLVNAADYGDTRCLNPFPANTFTGKVVICQRGTNARVDKGYNVLQGGAVGMIQYNPAIQGLASDNHWLPTVHLEYAEGQQLVSFFNTYKAVGITAALDGGVKVFDGVGDMMAAFSSRGGIGQTLGISKPDVSSIGVQVLAGHTPMPEGITEGPPGQYFQAIAGTSMSSPHIAGSAALLKALHPNWTPGQIKSALMSTATMNLVKEDGVTPADPFDFGSGREDLNFAGDPGMTVSDSAQNLWDLAGQLWNANLPSLYVPVFTGAFTTQRTFKSELPLNSCWQSSVDAPPDVLVKFPPTFCLGPEGSVTEAKTISIAVEGRNVPLGEVRFATLWLSNGTHTFHMPITIVRREGPVTLDKTCDPTAVEFGGTTDCKIEITNTSYDAASFYLQDRLPPQFNGTSLSTDPDTNPDWAWWMRRNRIEAASDLYPAQAPVPFMDVAPWGNGYFPLSYFGVAPISGVGDETIVNFNLSRPFLYGGQSYTRIGITSDGYAVVGGGTAADVQFVNQNLPDAARPNNVLAPFWSDLNPAFGGALRVAYLSSGGYYWLVLDWEGVENYSDGLPNDFQIWIGSSGVEDIAFAYGPNLSDGDGGFLTVGAENFIGNEGVNWYYNGAGTLPLPLSDDLIVYTQPGAPGETKTIYFSMVNRWMSDWQNCAVMNVNDDPQNLITACVNGTVTLNGESNSPMAPFAQGPDIWLPLVNTK